MKAIITLPNYDDATNYLYVYSEEIIKFAENKGIFLSKLKRPRLNKLVLKNMVNKQNPQLLLFNAHGDEKTIYGDKIKSQEDYLIREGENHNLLAGRLTYARACSSAFSLGSACTEKSGCFIGYNEPFSFLTDASRSTTPMKDKIAKLFLQPSNELIFSLLNGKSASQAVESFNKISKDNIRHLLNNENEPGALTSAMLLWNNMDIQRIRGDRDMKCDFALE